MKKPKLGFKSRSNSTVGIKEISKPICSLTPTTYSNLIKLNNYNYSNYNNSNNTILFIDNPLFMKKSNNSIRMVNLLSC